VKVRSRPNEGQVKGEIRSRSGQCQDRHVNFKFRSKSHQGQVKVMSRSDQGHVKVSSRSC